MSSLLELAADFEKQSKLMAASTSNSVAAALQQHERSLLKALRSSEQSLKSAISDQNTEVQRALKSNLKVSATVWLCSLMIAGPLKRSLQRV